MTPSISSEANTRPGTRMPGLCFSGSSHRRSSIFSRASFHLVTIICHLVSCGPPLSARPICWPPCPQASNIEQHLRPVAAVLLDHLQHVSRYRLHPEVQPVALPVYPLAPGPRPQAPPAYLLHDEPREQHLLRLPAVQELRQPPHQQPL